MLRLVWSDVPEDYQDKPVYSDYWGAYARFLAEEQHYPSGGGSGLTSRVEGLGTKWRQRQSGLVRRSCGVQRKREQDIAERFFLLVDEHHQQAASQWNRLQDQAGIATQLNP